MKIMSFLLLSVVPVGFSLSVAAQESRRETTTYDHNAIELLNRVMQDCPIQFIQSMTKADRVGSASIVRNGNDQEITVTTVSGGYFPDFQSFLVSELKIFRKAEEHPVLDAPMQYQVRCEIRFLK